MNNFFKLSITLLVIITFHIAGFGQDCTTTADATWDCGTPSESDNLIVNHSVEITSTFNATGHIIINDGGSLTFTENFVCVGCTITIYTGGTLIIQGTADIKNGSTIVNQGTMLVEKDLKLNDGASMTTEGELLVRGDLRVDGGATLLFETSSKTYVMNDVEFRSADITINGRLNVVGIFSNDQSITGTGQVNSQTGCAGSGTINGVDATGYCNSTVLEVPNLLCGPDTIAPAIANMPPDTIVYVQADACASAVSWQTPTASDNCALQSITSSHNPGASFALGTTQVTYTAVDDSNNTFSASFNITVKDTISPIIVNMPVNITLYVDGISCGNIVTWALPSATDNCSLQSFTSTHNPGDFFAAGTTRVTYTAVDVAQNTTTASFNVIIKDNITPSITQVPGNILAYAEANSCGTTVEWPLPVASDNCSVKSLTSNIEPGDFFEVGTTQVLYTALDQSNNTIIASFNVTVQDTVAPSITEIPQTITRYLEAGSCGATVDWPLPQASDNCSVQSFTSTSNPGDFFQAGSTMVTYTAVDASNNSVSASFEIFIKDTIPPDIVNMPESITLYSDASSCGEIVDWALPAATDDCALQSFTSSNNPGDFFEIGTTEVIYTAMDASQNTITASFSITILDTIAPVISNVPDIIAQYADAGSCGAVIDWPLPTATDNCSNVNLTSTGNPGDFFAIGTTLVTYTAVDASQNEVSAQFEIIVKDSISPGISELPQDITAYADADTSGTYVDWTMPTVIDDCSASLSYIFSPGDFFKVGTTTVTYTVADAGDNTVSDSFTITVIDTIPPVMQMPENITQYVTADTCGAIVDWLPPEVIDNWSLQSVTSTHDPGDFFAIDTTTVIYTAIDEAQNEVMDSFQVIVIDTIAPQIINMPENITVSADAGMCGARIDWTLPTVTDNCSASLTSNHNPGEFFNAGSTTVTYTATDIYGNVASASFEVIVMKNPEDEVQVAFNDTTIAIGSSIQLDVSANGVSYRWEPPDFLDHPGIRNPIATPTEGIMYTVVVRTASGCIDSKQVTVNVRPEDSFFIPEMFTPDGDGVNDMLFVNTVGYGAIDFKLFNRFGQLVFSTDDTDIGWDGTINGQLQKPDTYVYTLVVQVKENEFIKAKGTVQLVR